MNRERGVSVVYREISPNETLNKVQRIFMGMGVPEKDALRTADALMNAELSGVESHGLARLQAYSSRILKGLIDPKPNIQITVDGATAKVNGGNGLGQVVAWKSTEECIKLAKKYGIGIVSVSNSNHFGTAAYYTNYIADQGCIGFAASSSGPTMAPFGGTELLLGTNPFSIAFPGKEETFCADMATSAAAKGKIRIYAKQNKQLPIGWALDAEGNDTTDPSAAIKGILLPMGGHKGYALAMAVDAICSLLSGANLSCESSSMFKEEQTANTGHFFAALDIAHFLPPEEFVRRAQQWFDHIRSSKCRPGFDNIMIPGEPERKRRIINKKTLSISKDVADLIEKYYEEYGNGGCNEKSPTISQFEKGGKTF